MLDRALEAAGIARSDTYVTNVVKHFKWGASRKAMPGASRSREIGACLPWLQQELELIRPGVAVLLGATAAQALFGRAFRVTQSRGRPFTTALARHALATIHPSSILRMPSDDDRRREMARFVGDLQVAAALLKRRGPV